jgi:hypothetical protein
MIIKKRPLLYGATLTALAFLICAAVPTGAPETVDFSALGSGNRASAYAILDPLTKARGDLESQLVGELRANRANGYTKIAAAYLCGLYRAERTAPDLAAIIDLRDDRRDDPGTIGFWGEYPVQDALIRIGLPSVPPLVKNLATSDKELVRSLSISTLDHILGKRLARCALEEAASDPAFSSSRDALSRISEAEHLIDSSP